MVENILRLKSLNMSLAKKLKAKHVWIHGRKIPIERQKDLSEF